MPESKRRKPKNPGPTKPSRPTASVTRENPSPTWYVATMAGLMVAGVLVVLARFIFAAYLDQWVLLLGLGMIAAGFLMTTNYR